MVPAPLSTPETQPFWEGVDAGQLRLPWCIDCGAPHFYPRGFCPHCWSESLRWRVASGNGTVLSFGVPQRTPEGFDLDAPFVVAIVELEEGPRMLSNVLTDAGDHVSVGTAVRVGFRDVAGARRLPHFVPKAAAS